MKQSPEKKDLKLQVVLKWRDIYIENTRLVTLMTSLKLEGSPKTEWS